MPYRQISTDMKERALDLVKEGWTVDEVASILHISGKSIERWAVRMDNTGSVNPPSARRGRPRLLTAEIREEICQLITETPTLFLDEILEYLTVMHNVFISKTALHDNLRDLGITYKMVQRNAAERDEDARNAWREDIAANFTAEQIITVDESSKDGRTFFRKYGRSASGERPIDVRPLTRGTRYSILPALSLDGYIALRVVEGSVNSIEFYDFILNDVLPNMNRYPHPRSVLIMDNCSTHKSLALRDAVVAAGCLLLFLPPYSPDLNPIEESFSSVKYYLRRHWQEFQETDYPIQDLIDACLTVVTPSKARGWFTDCGYP